MSFSFFSFASGQRDKQNFDLRGRPASDELALILKLGPMHRAYTEVFLKSICCLNLPYWTTTGLYVRILSEFSIVYL